MRGPLEFLFLCCDLDKMIFEVLAGYVFCHGTGRAQDIQRVCQRKSWVFQTFAFIPSEGLRVVAVSGKASRVGGAGPADPHLL